MAGAGSAEEYILSHAILQIINRRPVGLVGKFRNLHMCGTNPVVIVHRVHGENQAELFHVAAAFDFLRFCFRFAQRRQQHTGEDGDDRDDHEQFDEGEFLFHFFFLD